MGNAEFKEGAPGVENQEIDDHAARNPHQRIRVFISSRCDGDGPFTRARRELAKKIEEMGFFSAYIWERGGAATTTAEQTYRMELRDSNICLFVLDNSVDVPEGVLNEIEEARICEKKCMFYFCVENGRKPLPLQEELRGPKGPTYTIVKRLFDVPDKVVADLREDVLRLYRGWCSNYVVAHEDFDSFSLGSSLGSSLTGLSKGCFQELDATSAFFANFLLDANLEEAVSGKLDAAILTLARSMYEDCNISMFDPSELLEAINGILPRECAKAVSNRWEAIRLYFSGDVSSAVCKLEEVLDSSERSRLDGWFVDDVLIDLRNILHEADGFNPTNRFQQQLDERPSSIVYPQIDRKTMALYERISDDEYKGLTQSIGAVTIGDNATRFLDGVVQVFAIAACFGSLTHLSRTAKHMRNVLQYLSQKYDSAKLNISFVKLAIVSGKRGDGESALQTFSTTRFDCDEILAMEFFEFCAGYRCMNDSGIAVFEAFKIVGCYLNESDYVSAQATFVKAAEEALARQDPWEPKPRSVFDAIRLNKNRLPVDWVVGMCEKAVVSGKHFWVNQALRMVALEGDYLLDASECSLTKLLDAIVAFLENPSDLVPSDLACDALAGFRGGGSPEQQERIEYATGLLPEPLKERCRRFSTEKVSDETLAILTGKQIEYLESANKTQGAGGSLHLAEIMQGCLLLILRKCRS